MTIGCQWRKKKNKRSTIGTDETVQKKTEFLLTNMYTYADHSLDICTYNYIQYIILVLSIRASKCTKSTANVSKKPRGVTDQQNKLKLIKGHKGRYSVEIIVHQSGMYVPVPNSYRLGEQEQSDRSH